MDLGALEESLRASFDGRFAGLWVDDSGGPAPDAIHIAVAALTGDDRESARQLLAELGHGVAYFLHSVVYTESELQGFVSPFLSLPVEGDFPEELTGVGIDVAENAVVISVSSPPKGRLAELISHIPSDAVRLAMETYRPL